MGLFSPTFDTLRDLYINELRDLYSAENQLLDALPKMANAANSIHLQEIFREHLEETKGQLVRLKQIFVRLDKKPSGEKCVAMHGLIKEAEDYVNASGNKDVCDAGMIGAAQRIEHYEIAGYGTARTLAMHLQEVSDAVLLQETLDEEIAADQKLTALAEAEVNVDASIA